MLDSPKMTMQAPKLGTSKLLNILHFLCDSDDDKFHIIHNKSTQAWNISSLTIVPIICFIYYFMYIMFQI